MTQFRDLGISDSGWSLRRLGRLPLYPHNCKRFAAGCCAGIIYVHYFADSFFLISIGVSKGLIASRFTITPQPVIARLVPGNPVIKPFGVAELLISAAKPPI
ncbi:hypothetical protein [Candidatus Spongiihabitans sp.]|uniref:hypothetical protein n=1 Tax=Candidatus Spongiihabitans sp. TaxID=3101308 RepID=UPI003C7ACB00